MSTPVVRREWFRAAAGPRQYRAGRWHLLRKTRTGVPSSYCGAIRLKPTPLSSGREVSFFDAIPDGACPICAKAKR